MKIEVFYKPLFVRQFDALPPALQEEILDAIELFKNPTNHRKLRVHKLKGRMASTMSFSVNYRYRIVFEYADKTRREARLLVVGDHDVYR